MAIRFERWTVLVDSVVCEPYYWDWLPRAEVFKKYEKEHPFPENGAYPFQDFVACLKSDGIVWIPYDTPDEVKSWIEEAVSVLTD